MPPKKPKLPAQGNQEEGSQGRRSTSSPNGAPKKRSAFNDITNVPALKVRVNPPGRTAESVPCCGCSASHQGRGSRHVPPGGGPGENLGHAGGATSLRRPGNARLGKVVKKRNVRSTLVSCKAPATLDKTPSESPEGSTVEIEKTEVQEVRVGEAKQEVQREAVAPVEEPKTAAPPAVHKVPAHVLKPHIPPEFDIDSENAEDCYFSPEYAKNIFDYLKKREGKFVLSNYMTSQPSLNAEMRAILVDWLVEVQENFELHNETLYLAVKITDHYLAKTSVDKDMLQLVGSTALLIAAKFEEHSLPSVEDFLYICDDAYIKEELITMEGNILKTLYFDISIPIAYSFLRRYAKCVNAGMDTLTLARFFCETSLLEMDLVTERGSLLASACLLLALITKDLGGWTPCLQFHSGYRLSDLCPVVRKLYFLLSAPPDKKLSSVRNKYSHKVFFEVAKLPLLDLDVYEKALSCEL